MTFTHEVWEEILPKVDRDFPGSQIVGWYHSHPGFGLFLSEYDRFIHDSFFADAGMLALVLDPVAGNAGWFTRKNAKLDLTEEFEIKAVPRPTTDAGPEAAGSQRGSRALIAVAVLLVGFVGGYWLRGGDDAPKRTTANPAVSASEAQAAAQAADRAALEAEIARLRASGISVPEPPTFYVVQRGDTLWSIAEKELGDGHAWPLIARLNPTVQKPGHVLTGTRLLMPLKPSASTTTTQPS